VRQVELVHAAPRPAVPRLAGALGRGRLGRVAFEHRHPVPVPGEQRGGGESGEPGTKNQQIGHARKDRRERCSLSRSIAAHFRVDQGSFAGLKRLKHRQLP
jgi:hypothetical protein